VSSLRLGRGLINAHPEPDRRKLNESEVVRHQPVVPLTRRWCFDLVKEALGQIAGSIQIWAEANGSPRLHRGGMSPAGPCSRQVL
jgi:hypothetical protein